MAKSNKSRKAQQRRQANTLRSNTVRSKNQLCSSSKDKNWDLSLIQEPTFMALMYGALGCFEENTVRKAPKFNLLLKKNGVEIAVIYSTNWVEKEPSFGDFTYFFEGLHYFAVWVKTSHGGGFWVNRAFNNAPTFQEKVEFHIGVCSSTIPFLLDEYKDFFTGE